MRAIILTAGKGERLKGLVDTVPKPMVPIGGRPILQHNIEWLRGHGVTDIYINLHHLAHRVIDHFDDGTRFGVRITYSYEKDLLGTAGAVRKIADEFREFQDVDMFLVVHGDNQVNYNLKKVIAFHHAHNGMGTIVLYRKDDVSRSRIVVLDSAGRVMRFIEKPKEEEHVSSLVNTGVYILNRDTLRYIPEGESLDFGREVFPRMLKCGEALYGIEVSGRLIAMDTPDLFRAALED
ncbi:MAG: nucleotidyltransferase family protein [Syntrophorhabdales bacterium]|jgi:NDP-sugar pyrophosphorylase family protein